MRGTVPALYNADALAELPSDAVVYLVEGFTDTFTLAAHGFAAVGLVGAGGLKEEWLAPLARFRVVAALDPDAAGRRAAARYAEMFSARGCASPPSSCPPTSTTSSANTPSASLELSLLAEAALEDSEQKAVRVSSEQ